MMGLGSLSDAEEPDARQLVAKANQAFEAGEYDQALAGYREAELSAPESPEVAYNQAIAQYKLGDFPAARSFFNRALATRDLGLEAGVKYNLGNVAYSLALEKMSKLQEALDLLKQAIGHYRDALELAPDDEDAKANIHMAQLLIKDLLDKLQQQQEPQPQQGDSGDQDQQQDPQQDGQQPQNQEEEQDQTQDGQQQQQGAQAQQQQQDASEQRQASIREMTQEEADRLLQAVRDKERRRREERARRLRAPRAKVLKDW